MSEFNNNGNINAGRDNVINVGDQQTYKDIYQMTPDELRAENGHSRKVSWNYRLDRIRKSKILFLVLIIGIVGLGFIAIFVKDLFIDYTGGASPNIRIIVRFIWDMLDSVKDQTTFLMGFMFTIAGFMVFLVFPAFAISNLWLSDDEFLKDEKQRRNKIRKRILSLGEKL